MELIHHRALLVLFGIITFIRSMIDIQFINFYMTEPRERDKPAVILTIILFTLLLSGTIALWNKKKTSIYFLSIYSAFYAIIYAGVFLHYFEIIKIDRSYQDLVYPVYTFITGIILSSIFLLILWALFEVGKSSDFKTNKYYLSGVVLFSFITAITLIFTF